MQLTSVLVPSKFLLCILQLILVIVVIQTKDEYIASDLPADASSSGSDYTKTKSR